MKERNQQNPPSRKSVDKNGNNHRRFGFKDGGTTMPIAKLPSKNACRKLEEVIKDAVDKLGGKMLKVEVTNFQ